MGETRSAQKAGALLVARKLSNWIEAFDEAATPLPSPSVFRKWAAIAAVAGALERKVWVYTYGSNLYPTLFIVVVGRPAGGKTVLSKRVFRLWKALPEHYIASSNVTKASLADELENAKRSVYSGADKALAAGNGTFNSIQVASNELGNMIPGYSSEMMNFLTDIFDGEPYGETRRGRKDDIYVEKPQINMFACTTPSYMSELMPEGAWDQGFASRLIMIYSGEITTRSLFSEAPDNAQLWKNLEDDLKHIGQLHGKMKFTEDAAREMDDWHMKGGPPKPEHPRLIHYCGRRSQHVLKLSMIASVVESDNLIIERKHVRRAQKWLFEAEATMPKLFKAMTNTGTTQIVEETWYFVTSEHARTKKPVPEADIIRFMSAHVDEAWKVDPLFKNLVRAKIIQKSGTGYVGAKKA